MIGFFMIYNSCEKKSHGGKRMIYEFTFDNFRSYKIEQISEATFEYNVKHDIILSPVFQNESDFNRMLNVLPYYQSIQREGIAIG